MVKLLHFTRALYSKDHGYEDVCGCIPRWVWVWFVPIFIAGCGFYLQNFQLHYTTYFYVHQMKQFDLQRGFVNISEQVEPIPLTIGETPFNVSFGSVDDPLSEMVGYKNIKIGFLDFLAVFIPALFVLTSVALDNNYTYSRAMFCFAFMEVLKGLVDLVTVVPDSSGWQVCKDRLATSTAGYTVEWYSKDHGFWDIFWSQLFAPTGRFCSDMMLSGHTQAVTVFGLGLFESITLVANLLGWEERIRFVVETVVAVVVILQQVLEVYFVLKSRFHYSSDILMALVVSYLVYTSAPMAWLASCWEFQGMHIEKFRGKTLKKMKEDFKNLSRDMTDDSYFGQGKSLNDKITKYTPFLDNRWLRMFTPRMIQLGCCCTSRAQLYLINRRDVVGILNTVESLMNDIKAVKGGKEVLNQLKDFEMNDTVKHMMLDVLGLPPNLESEDHWGLPADLESCVAKKPHQEPSKKPHEQPLLAEKPHQQQI